jgi:hypothetical protein
MGENPMLAPKGYGVARTPWDAVEMAGWAALKDERPASVLGGCTSLPPCDDVGVGFARSAYRRRGISPSLRCEPTESVWRLLWKRSPR